MTDIDTIIAEYADAQAHANDGMKGTWPTVQDNRGQPCTPQMARLHDAEDAILALAGQPSLPPQVQAFIEASADRGCSWCWITSGRQHIECRVKINRWFAARIELVRYGRSLGAVVVS